MKILFLHGKESKPGGKKAVFLEMAGHTVLNPLLPKFKALIGLLLFLKIAKALSPKSCPSLYPSNTSFTVASYGRLLVFEIAPDTNGCIAPSILMCPSKGMLPSPLAFPNAVAKTL